MVQRGGVLRLGPEAGAERGVAGELAAQHLHRDRPLEQGVAGPPDPAHAAAGERHEELVPVAEQADSRFHAVSSARSRPPWRGLTPAGCQDGTGAIPRRPVRVTGTPCRRPRS